jgi:hypothetical protein
MSFILDLSSFILDLSDVITEGDATGSSCLVAPLACIARKHELSFLSVAVDLQQHGASTFVLRSGRARIEDKRHAEYVHRIVTSIQLESSSVHTYRQETRSSKKDDRTGS